MTGSFIVIICFFFQDWWLMPGKAALVIRPLAQAWEMGIKKWRGLGRVSGTNSVCRTQRVNQWTWRGCLFLEICKSLQLSITRHTHVNQSPESVVKGTHITSKSQSGKFTDYTFGQTLICVTINEMKAFSQVYIFFFTSDLMSYSFLSFKVLSNSMIRSGRREKYHEMGTWWGTIRCLTVPTFLQ